MVDLCQELEAEVELGKVAARVAVDLDMVEAVMDMVVAVDFDFAEEVAQGMVVVDFDMVEADQELQAAGV